MTDRMTEHEAMRRLAVPARHAFTVLAQVDAYAERFAPCTLSRVDGMRQAGAAAWTGEAALRFELPKIRLNEDVASSFAVRADELRFDIASRARSMPGQELRLSYRIASDGPERCTMRVRLAYERLGAKLFVLSFATVRERLVGQLADMIERAARTLPDDASLRRPDVAEGDGDRHGGR